MKGIVVSIIMTMFACAVSNSGVLNVPSEYETIADALVFAQECDTILLDSGVYSGEGFRDLEFDTLCISLISLHGPELTHIELDAHFFLHLPESVPYPGWVIVKGITFSGGSNVFLLDEGGWHGIFTCHCRFMNNSIVIRGDYPAHLFVDSCEFVGNNTAISIVASEFVWIYRSLFRDNDVGFYFKYAHNCMVMSNILFSNGTGATLNISGTNLWNNVFYRNDVGIRGISVTFQSLVLANDVFGNLVANYEDFPDQTGIGCNISENPYFCDTSLQTSTDVAYFSPLLPDNNDCDTLIGDVSVGCTCCLGTVGSVQLEPDCDYSEQVVDISDLTDMIDHLFISYTPICCPEEADIAPAINGGQPDDITDIADLTALIDHLFINSPSLPACP